MNYNLRQTLGLESAEIFSPSTIVLEDTEVSSEVELVNEVQEVHETSSVILKASSDMDMVEDSVATLESILLTLEVSMEQHSINNITHALTYVSLENIEKRFGLTSGYLTVGLEEVNEENMEVAATGMTTKIKSMLSQLKGAGLELLDKIAQGIEVVRKDIAKIGTRVKQRIQALRSNINRNNKGGVELKAGGLKKLTGIANNGVVNGSSFMPKLTQTAATVNGIVNATGKHDVLSAYVESLKNGNQQTIQGATKVYSAYLASMKGLSFTHEYTDSGGTVEKTEPLINGKVIFKYGLDPDLVKAAFKEIDSMATEIDRDFLATEANDEIPKEKLSKLKALGEKAWEKIKSLGNRFKGSLPYLLKAIAWSVYGIIAAFSAFFGFLGGIPLIAIGAAPAVLILVLMLLSIGVTVAAVINVVVNIYRAGKAVVLGSKTEGSEEETTEVTPVVPANLPKVKLSTDALINIVLMGCTSFAIRDGAKSKDVTKVESLSAKDIDKACGILDSLCDSTINYVTGTKDRKALITEYRKLTKGTKIREGEYDVDVSRQLTEFIKDNISFEVDLCRSMSSVLLSGITYLEASNNATTVEAQ